MLGFRNEAAAAVGNGVYMYFRYRCPCSPPPRPPPPRHSRCSRQRLNGTKSGSQPVRKQLHCSHTHTHTRVHSVCVGLYGRPNRTQSMAWCNVLPRSAEKCEVRIDTQY